MKAFITTAVIAVAVMLSAFLLRPSYLSTILAYIGLAVLFIWAALLIEIWGILNGYCLLALSAACELGFYSLFWNPQPDGISFLGALLMLSAFVFLIFGIGTLIWPLTYKSGK